MVAYNVAEIYHSSEMSAQLYTLAPGAAFAWHYHPAVADAFIILEGSLCLELNGPSERIELSRGGYYRVEPGRIHRSANFSSECCTFVSIVGPGTYGYVPVEIAE